ncbi:MAG: hypothetical protein GY866_09425, partial [Proteobacteria bacterium]|nr:hypothetical protein [Pseudomonadota bacterium]
MDKILLEIRTRMHYYLIVILLPAFYLLYKGIKESDNEMLLMCVLVVVAAVVYVYKFPSRVVFLEDEIVIERIKFKKRYLADNIKRIEIKQNRNSLFTRHPYLEITVGNYKFSLMEQNIYLKLETVIDFFKGRFPEKMISNG